METNKNLVLVVDDVEQNVAVLSQVLRNFGYQVMVAFSGEAALKMVDKRLPDLILLDVMMPGIDGFETCRQLKTQEKTKDIPVIFLSALSESDTKVKGLETGGVDYISKPFHEAEVVARVSVHLQIRNLEREKLQHIAQLQRMNEEKDRLVQIVSHDLRSPLGGIMGLTNILIEGEEASDPETVRYFSSVIRSSTENLLQLVNDLLDLAKIESGKIDTNFTQFNLIHELNTSFELLRFMATSKGLTLVVDTTDECINVCADKPKIIQLTSNLLTNAIKFTKSGTIRVSVRSAFPDKNSVTILISDTGVGIPNDMLPILFDKFGKHQRVGTKGEKGSGLGMPIVKRFIELHNGTISVQSELNVGTTFELTLPIIEQKEIHSYPPPQQTSNVRV